jgi:23S rRNA (adenine2030-N6)-methyltransferase
MLSYRHAFHAGNFADVLKHSVYLHLLEYLTRKETPLRIIDTHAGAGTYSLTGNQPLKNREYDTGIGLLWNQPELPELLANYVHAVRSFNPDNQLRFYPGSPLLTQMLLRPQDRVFLHELHGTDCRFLKKAIGPDRRIKVIEEDGLQGMQGLLPPPDRRALTLIDPSYEIKSDYQQVVRQLKDAHKRFGTGTYALWYPVVRRQRIDELEHALQKSGIRNIQLFELGIAPDSMEHGMTATGMIIINPPWTLWSAMESALPWLAENLSPTHEGFFRQVQLVDE